MDSLFLNAENVINNKNIDAIVWADEKSLKKFKKGIYCGGW